MRHQPVNNVDKTQNQSEIFQNQNLDKPTISIQRNVELSNLRDLVQRRIFYIQVNISSCAVRIETLN